MESPARYTIRSSSRGARSVLAPAAPEHRGPRHGRGGERGDGVDLGLVGVLPVGEGEGAEHARRPRRRRRRSSRAVSSGRSVERAPHRSVDHEKEQPGRRGAEERAQQVGAVGLLADRHQQCPRRARCRTKSGVPGGWGIPRVRAAAMNSPASQNVTVGARVSTIDRQDRGADRERGAVRRTLRPSAIIVDGRASRAPGPGQRLAGGGDGVDPEEPGAALPGQRARRRRRPVALFDRQAGDRAEEPLARRADQERPAEGVERRRAGRTALTLCSTVLENPNPGSSTIDSAGDARRRGGRPAPRAARPARPPPRHRRSRRDRRTRSPAARPASASGSPRRPRPPRQRPSPGSSRNAATSFTMAAPASSAAGRPPTSPYRSRRSRSGCARASASTTGTTRAQLLLGGHRLGSARPGGLAADVDDRGAVPSSASACASAASAPAKRPPSLKLSGVTLRMPTRTGRSSGTGPRAVCHTGAGSAGMASPTWSASSGSGSGAVQGRAKALSRERLPGEDRPVVAGDDLEAEAAAEPDQGLERALVQSGQMECEGMDAAGGGAGERVRPTRGSGALHAPLPSSGAPAA